MGLSTKKLKINGIEYDLASNGSGSNIDVIDNLESTDTESALSANQGKILNEKIEGIESQSVVADYDEENKILDLEFNVPVQGIIEDTLESDSSYNALSAKQGKVLKEAVDTATAIVKGKNQARVFATTAKMYEWLSDEANKGVAMKGDNLYIVDIGVPDWWIAEVLETPNAEGRYYEIAQLETQKVDLTTIIDAINEINSNLDLCGTVDLLYTFGDAVETEVTVPDMSVYKQLLVGLFVNDGNTRRMVGSTIVPRSTFVSGSLNVQIFGSNENQWGLIKSTQSNTSLICNRTAANTFQMAIWGIR